MEESKKRELEEELLFKVDKRISVGLATHTLSISQKVREDMRDEWDKFLGNSKEELKTIAEEIFENMEFLTKFKKHIHRYMDQELSAQLSKQELHDMIRSIVKNITKGTFSEVIGDVIKEAVKQTNKKLKQEYKIAKELCYSIDSSIKHLLINSNISAVSEEQIKEKMLETINEVAKKNTRRIEGKVETKKSIS